jgi:hypothetical protein
MQTLSPEEVIRFLDAARETDDYMYFATLVAEFLENAGVGCSTIKELVDSGNLIGLEYHGEKFYMRKLPGAIFRDSSVLNQNN